MQHTFSSSEAIKTGWQYTKKYFWTIMKLGAITYLPTMIVQIISLILVQIPGATEMIPNPISIALIGSIGTAWLGIGLLRSYLMILQDKKPTIKNLCVPSSYLVRLIIASILNGLAIIGGLICFIIPGIYIAIRFAQFKYFIAEGYGAIDSLKASRACTKDNVWKLIGFGFISLGVAILGFLALVVGLLWAIPTIALAQVWIYTQLKKNTPDTFKAIE